MCEIAMRCGIAVIGTYMPSGIADERAEHETAGDPAVVEDLVVDQRAADGEQHADRGVLHPSSRGVRLRQAPQAEDEEESMRRDR